ncbi:MAG: NAD(P)/FAD-dependent oxidoreductase [Candidatus Bipolaricaulia bacterium]
MLKTADVVIIGGGVMGASIAFNLAERGVINIALLEKDALASGSTGKSSAIIRTHYSHEVTAKMALNSLKEFQDFADRVGGTADFVKTGFVVIVSKNDIKNLEENVQMQREIGINTQVISAEELKEFQPYLSTDDFATAAFEPDSGYADPAATTYSYARRAQDLGAKIYQGTPAISIQLRSDKVNSVTTPQGSIASPIVVNAAGPWSAMLAEPVGVELPFVVSRAQVANIQRPPEFAERYHPVYADFIHSIYLKPEEGQQTIVGSISAEEAEDRVQDPDNYKDSVDEAFKVEVTEKVCQRFPAFRSGLFKGGWAGLYTISPDWHPVIDQVGPEGFYCVSGFSGHGFKLAPAIGDMVAELIIDGRSSDINASFFSASRFADARPIKGKYEYSILG